MNDDAERKEQDISEIESMILRAITSKPEALNTIEAANKYLRWIDETIDPDTLTDEQKEYRDQFEWAIKNAHKLRVMFFGVADKGSLDEVGNAWVKIRYALGSQGESPSNMIH